MTVHAVTGPFSYTGRYIAERLRGSGIEVRGLVRTVPDNARGIDCRSLQFSDEGRLAADLAGVEVLYNTYWIRFEHGTQTFAQAVQNTRILASAATQAGIGRIVHLSVSNPSPGSPFGYFRGKAAAETAIQESGTPYSVIRPTLVFGDEDILINNIAWLLRRFHLFALPGNGTCRVQPVFVDDVAGLAVEASRGSDNQTLDAAGPETLTFKELLAALAGAVKARALFVPAPMGLALSGGRVLSTLLGDIVITREELGALVAETLVSADPPTATTKLSDWLNLRGAELGHSYTSELNRHWQ